MTVGSLSVSLLLLAADCASPDVSASRTLGGAVKIDGYRKVSDYKKLNTTEVYFVGPADVDLTKALSVDSWTGGPPPYEESATLPYEWVIDGTAQFGKRECAMLVYKLRRAGEKLARGLSSQESQDLKAGRLDYVKVAFVCGPI